jgi:hypothetical protein
MAERGQQSFSAQVDAWVQQTEQRMDAVFKESTQRVFEEVLVPVGAGGNMPVDTGFLRASFQATLNAPTTTPTFRPENPGTYTPDVAQVALVINGATRGDTIYGVFTANYAVDQEYGSRGRDGRGFVRLAAQRWQQIVSAVASELQARVTGFRGSV